MGSVFQRATTTCRTGGTTTQHAIISHYFPWAREGISGGPFIYFAGSSKKDMVTPCAMKYCTRDGRFDERTDEEKKIYIFFGAGRLKPIALDEYLSRLMKSQEKEYSYT